MNRRAFLKLFVGTVAVATVPIPNFLLPKQYSFKEFGPGRLNDFDSYGSSKAFTVDDGTTTILTQEMIEEAMQKAAMNHGRPDVMYMSKQSYKTFAKVFGYKVVYVDDMVIHES